MDLQLASLIPTVLGCLWLIALASDREGACAGNTSGRQTIRGHLRAIANHCRELAVLIADRCGASGGHR